MMYKYVQVYLTNPKQISVLLSHINHLLYNLITFIMNMS